MWFYFWKILQHILNHLCWGVLPVFTHMGMRAGASAARVCRPCWICSTASIALGFNKADSCSGLCIYTRMTVNNKDINDQIRTDWCNKIFIKLPSWLKSSFLRFFFLEGLQNSISKLCLQEKKYNECYSRKGIKNISNTGHFLNIQYVYHMCFRYMTAVK